MLAIDILIWLLAALPSEIVQNLNNLNTLLPLTSDTTYGVTAG